MMNEVSAYRLLFDYEKDLAFESWCRKQGLAEDDDTRDEFESQADDFVYIRDDFTVECLDMQEFADWQGVSVDEAETMEEALDYGAAWDDIAI